MADKALHARLVVHGLGNMRSTEKRRLASWLRSQADTLERAPHNDDAVDNNEKYADKYTARLFK